MINVEDENRLLPETRDMLDKDNDIRISYIRLDKWIPYPQANTVLDRLEELLVIPKKARMTSCLIVGDSNNGKSSLAQEFYRLHPPTDGVQSSALPVIWALTPNTPDEGRLYNNILEEIKVPFKYKDIPSKKEHEVVHYFKELDTRMLILDDIHNILSGPVTKQKIFMNSLRTLSNRLSIPIVLLGIKDALRAVATDDQIISRFPPIALPKWRLDRNYLSLLASIERTLPLKKKSNLASQELAPKILDLSEGCIGDIIDLVNKAAITAIQTNTERVSSKEIADCKFIKPSQRRNIADQEMS